MRTKFGEHNSVSRFRVIAQKDRHTGSAISTLHYMRLDRYSGDYLSQGGYVIIDVCLFVC